MNVRSLYVLIAALSVLLPGNRAFGRSLPLKFSYLTVEEGLTHTDAKAICQDRSGFLWIATLYGLDRYDGYTIKKFYNSHQNRFDAASNRIRTMAMDPSGRLWMGTECGIQLFDPHTETYTDLQIFAAGKEKGSYDRLLALPGSRIATLAGENFQLFQSDRNTLKEIFIPGLSKQNIREINLDAVGNLWLVSSNRLFVLDHHLILKTFELSSNVLPPGGLRKIFITDDSTLLLAGQTRLLKLLANPLDLLKQARQQNSLEVSKTLDIPDAVAVNDLVCDRTKNYWLSTVNGLYQLNAQLKLTRTIRTTSFAHSLNTNLLYDLFIDRSECLWICTFGGGVNFIDLNAKRFHRLIHDPLSPNSLSGNHVRSVVEESGKYLWIGTNSDGLNRYDRLTGKFMHFAAGRTPAGLKSNEVDALEVDNDRHLWIGTGRGLQLLDPERKNFFLKADFPKHQVVSLKKDCYGNIWFGSYNNGFGVILKTRTGQYRVSYKAGGDAHYLWADKTKPELCVSGTGGFRRLTVDPQGNIVKELFLKAESKEYPLSSTYLFPVQKQGPNTFYIGTIGSGMDKLTIGADGSYQVHHTGIKQGLFPEVESLELDRHGNVWMGGNGLARLDASSGKLTRYDQHDGLQGNSFKVGASCSGADGQLYFGGVDGLTFFDPDSIRLNKLPVTPVFTDLFIDGRVIDLGRSNDNNPTDVPTALPASKKVVLNYLQNNFALSFSAMYYPNPAKCRFRYQLIGYDQEWQYTNGSSPRAAYSNMPYRAYTLVLEASNSDGIWSKNKALLSIVVSPPWWLSTAAKLGYCLLLLGALAGLYGYTVRWFRLKQRLAVQQVEEEKREEMHRQRENLYQQQLQLFTNISHELRTPLSLILGPLEVMLGRKELPAARHNLTTMYQNGKRLGNLINELMNFRKAAEGFFQLHVAPVSLQDFAKNIYHTFEDHAARQQVHFKLALPAGDTHVCIDTQVIEKILFNLLSNALKYTAAGGRVALKLSLNLQDLQRTFSTEFRLDHEVRSSAYLYISVADSGIGISKESITRIFDRYYRVSPAHLGSGVGLAIVKALTELHKGDIAVYSDHHQGTEILIAIPIGEKDYTVTERAPSNSAAGPAQFEPLDLSLRQLPAQPLRAVSVECQPERTKKRVLIVEDNEELRCFLHSVLSQEYLVDEGADGQQGLDIALEKKTDLIISDLMMPVMNGCELCRQIKQNEDTSHIPFIMLSAKDVPEARSEGMGSGADHYFAKPLNIELLLLTLRNIFMHRDKLRERYRLEDYSEASKFTHQTQDKAFVDKLFRLIDDNLQAQGLDVDFLCDQMYTSRSKLYQKIKSITGQSVTELIRTQRLRKAAHIMTHEQVTQIEIVDRIGIQSLSYFQKSFRKEFGMTPSAFLKNLKNVN